MSTKDHDEPMWIDDQVLENRLDETTRKTLRTIVREAGYHWLVLFIPILALWMMIKLFQWYGIHSKNQTLFHEILTRGPITQDTDEQKLVRSFLKLKQPLWISVLLWPAVAVLGLIGIVVLSFVPKPDGREGLGSHPAMTIPSDYALAATPAR